MLRKRDQQFKSIKDDLLKKNKDVFLFASTTNEDENEEEQRPASRRREEATSETTNMGSRGSLQNTHLVVPFDT